MLTTIFGRIDIEIVNIFILKKSKHLLSRFSNLIFTVTNKIFLNFGENSTKCWLLKLIFWAIIYSNSNSKSSWIRHPVTIFSWCQSAMPYISINFALNCAGRDATLERPSFITTLSGPVPTVDL